jgi:hypothetical protein
LRFGMLRLVFGFPDAASPKAGKTFFFMGRRRLVWLVFRSDTVCLLA